MNVYLLGRYHTVPVPIQFDNASQHVNLEKFGVELYRPDPFLAKRCFQSGSCGKYSKAMGVVRCVQRTRQTMEYRHQIKFFALILGTK